MKCFKIECEKQEVSNIPLLFRKMWLRGQTTESIVDYGTLYCEGEAIAKARRRFVSRGWHAMHYIQCALVLV